MTPVEKEITARLQSIPRFDNFKEGKFVDQLPQWRDREMTDAGRAYLLRLLDRYSHLIPDADDLRDMHIQERLAEI